MFDRRRRVHLNFQTGVWRGLIARTHDCKDFTAVIIRLFVGQPHRGASAARQLSKGGRTKWRETESE